MPSTCTGSLQRLNRGSAKDGSWSLAVTVGSITLFLFKKQISKTFDSADRRTSASHEASLLIARKVHLCNFQMKWTIICTSIQPSVKSNRPTTFANWTLSPVPAVPWGELGGCLGCWTKGGAKKDQKMQLFGSENDERTQSRSECTWLKLNETHVYAVYENTEVLNHFRFAT